MNSTLIEAYRYCSELVRRHYENFPVASAFLPKHLRPPVAAVYAFARTADDIADEGDRTPEERLRALADWQSRLDTCCDGTPDHPIFVALADVMQRYAVPRRLFADLLTAFRMDVTVLRYATFVDVLEYCRHSANPVGRIVLHLFGNVNDNTVRLSDRICTALQLTNFWQDVRSDAQRGRIYIPLEDMRRFGYTERELLSAAMNDRFADLLRFEIERTRALFREGRALLHEAVPQLRFELKLTWYGGMTILKKIERNRYDVFRTRPVLTTADAFSIVLKAIFPVRRDLR